MGPADTTHDQPASQQLCLVTVSRVPVYDAMEVPLQVVCPDVILIGYDSLISDVAQLQEVEWEVAVLDERECAASTLSKAHQALREMNCIHKLLLSPSIPARVGVLYTHHT